MVLGWDNLQFTQDQVANLIYAILSSRIHSGSTKEFRRPTTHLLVLLAAQYADKRQNETEADDMEKLLEECVKEQKRALDLEQRRFELKLCRSSLCSSDLLNAFSDDSVEAFGSASDVLIWKLTEQAELYEEETSAARESTGQDGEDLEGQGGEDEPQPLPITRSEVTEKIKTKRIASWRDVVSQYPCPPAPPSAAAASATVNRKRKRSANEASPRATVKSRTRRRDDLKKI